VNNFLDALAIFFIIISFISSIGLVSAINDPLIKAVLMLVNNPLHNHIKKVLARNLTAVIVSVLWLIFGDVK